MTDSVELLLEPEAERYVLEDWAVLEREGLPNLSRHGSWSNAPHITLAAASRIHDRYDAGLATAAISDPFELVVGGFLVFPTRRKFVLARQIVTGDALSDLHRRVWSALDGLPDSVPLTEGGLWTPHITLAHSMTAGQLAAALDVLRERAPERLGAGPVRRWDSREKRVVLLAGGDPGSAQPV